MKTNKAALLDEWGQVVGEVFDAPSKGYTIRIAGSIDENGQVYNIHNYKISR